MDSLECKSPKFCIDHYFLCLTGNECFKDDDYDDEGDEDGACAAMEDGACAAMGASITRIKKADLEQVGGWLPPGHEDGARRGQTCL